MSHVVWWVVRATQDEVRACVLEAGLRATVSPRTRSGLVSAFFPDLAEVPALLPDRDQFELAVTSEGPIVSGWHSSGVELDWRAYDDDPGGRQRATAFFGAFGARPEALLSVLSREKTTAGRLYIDLVLPLGVPIIENLLGAVVAWDGDPETARRAGHLHGPCVLVRGDSGWTYLTFPFAAIQRAMQALGVLAQVGACASPPFLVAELNTGWFARFEPPQGSPLVVGTTWQGVSPEQPVSRAGDELRADFFAAEGRTPETVGALLEQADTGELPLGQFLAELGRPTFAARLLGPLADEVGDRAEHLAKLAPDEIKRARIDAAVYAATAPTHVVSAGFALAASTLFIMLAMVGATRGRLLGAFILLAGAVVLWSAGILLWRRRGRLLRSRRQPQLS